MVNLTKTRQAADNFLADPATWEAPVFIMALTFLVFLPARWNGFTNWDDPLNLIHNDSYRGFGWTQLRWMFTTFHGTLYRPATWLTLALDHRLWGMNPAGYHLTSVLFHCLNAAIFYYIALALLRLAAPEPALSGWALVASAGVSALLFALHPLRVEAVTWVSARNDVVAPTGWLLAFYGYLRACAATSSAARKAWLTGALIAYTFSLLAKSVGMTLPLVLLLVDVYPLRRIDLADAGRRLGQARHLLWEKLPFFALAAAAAAVSVLAKQQAIHSRWKYGLGVRIADCVYGLGFYLWKTLAPVNLSPLYSRTADRNPWEWPILLSGALILLITATLWIKRKNWPAGWVCWLYYIVSLLPMLGIVQYGPQTVADRYSYLSCLSWAVLAGGGVYYLFRRQRAGRAFRTAAILCAGGIAFSLGGLSLLTWRQIQVWHDSERLWRQALASQPSAFAHISLAAELTEQGRQDEALQHYREAAALEPADADANFDLAMALYSQTHLDEAFDYFNRVAQMERGRTRHTIYFYTANILAKQGKFAAARTRYQTALRLNPDYAEAHRNLGHVEFALGNYAAAAQSYRAALRLDRNLADTRYALAQALLRTEAFAAASEELQQVVESEPNFAYGRYYLATALIAQKQWDKAVAQLQWAIVLEPNFIEAHQALSQALAHLGNSAEASQHRLAAERLAKASAIRQPEPAGAKPSLIPGSAIK